MYNSLTDGSSDWQSASLPGSSSLSMGLARRTRSLALRAASRARAALTAFSIIDLAIFRVFFQNSH